MEELARRIAPSLLPSDGLNRDEPGLRIDAGILAGDVALEGRSPSVVPTRTSWPSLISLARCSGTVKSTFMEERPGSSQ